MPASNIYELYQFETSLVSASKAVLSNAGITAYSVSDMSTGSFATPSVTVTAIVGAPTGHMKISGSKGYHDSWNIQLGAMVTTDRSINAASHYAYTSKVAALLADPSNYNSGSNLPYHLVRLANYNGSNPRISEAENFDLTELSFALQLWVKPTAWP